MNAQDARADHTQAALRQLGIRLTPRREAVLRALAESHAHPSARELKEMLSRQNSGISLATVYNSLNFLQKAGLVNEHRLSSGPARYCVNFNPHMHLVDEASGRMVDVFFKEGVRPEEVFELPSGARVESIKAYLHGHVPATPI